MTGAGFPGELDVPDEATPLSEHPARFAAIAESLRARLDATGGEAAT